MASAADHAALMDGIYRGQRHIYDATRKYYLFGRDRLIRHLALEQGGAVLEVACGTGRNLARIGQHWPQARLHGLDISREMLASATVRLKDKALLAQGDATAFDPQALFGAAAFDRIVISYALSMIPDWRAALLQSAGMLAQGGSLHIVDFGDMAGIPAPLRAALRGWLRRFHVTPRTGLAEFAFGHAARHKLRCRTRSGPFGYYQSVVISRP